MPTSPEKKNDDAQESPALSPLSYLSQHPIAADVLLNATTAAVFCCPAGILLRRMQIEAANASGNLSLRDNITRIQRGKPLSGGAVFTGRQAAISGMGFPAMNACSDYLAKQDVSIAANGFITAALMASLEVTVLGAAEIKEILAMKGIELPKQGPGATAAFIIAHGKPVLHAAPCSGSWWLPAVFTHLLAKEHHLDTTTTTAAGTAAGGGWAVLTHPAEVAKARALGAVPPQSFFDTLARLPPAEYTKGMGPRAGLIGGFTGAGMFATSLHRKLFEGTSPPSM